MEWSLNEISAVAQEMGEAVAADLERVEVLLERAQELAHTSPRHAQAVEALTDEADRLRAALEVYANAPDATPAPYLAVLLLQEQAGGGWWCVWRYASARFHTPQGATRWGAQQLANLRARPFAPREAARARRLVVEVWNLGDPNDPQRVALNT